MAEHLDGIATAATIKCELRQRVERLQADGRAPGLGTLLVGQDPGSVSYVTGKHRDCAEVGIASIRKELPAEASGADIARAVAELNSDDDVTGYITQLPLPAGIDENAVLESIDPGKDADGLHPANLGRLVLTTGGRLLSPLPCTPAGIVELLLRHNVPISGRRVTVIGRGVTVGRPLGLLLTRRGLDATVTLTHSRTVDLPGEIRRADIVVAALGAPHFVKPEWVKPGAAVLDVGVTRVGTTTSGKAKLAGDVHPDVESVAGWLSPNPGGVGPMTPAMLLSNIVTLAEQSVTRGDA